MSMAANTMSNWSNLLFSAALGGVCLCVYLLHVLREKGKTSSGIKGKHKLPPGPRGLPILGILPKLGSLPHVTFHRWAEEYGPIMYLWLGQVPTVIVSSPQAAEKFFKTHDLIFASRPISEVGRHILFGNKGMSFSQYGLYWRNVRKLCILNLLSNLKIESFRPVRKEEVGLLVRSLKDAAQAIVPVNLTTELSGLSRDLACRMVVGKKCMEESLDGGGFNAVVRETMFLGGAFNLSDFIPRTRVLDLQGIGRRMKAVNKAFDGFFEKIIDEHMQTRREERQPDFVDFMLSFLESDDNDFQFRRTNMKAIMLEIMVAAIDTTATTLEWAMSELIKNPNVMKKAQEELERVVGKERTVDESDLVNLDYLDMVVKEAMRLHPALPLLVPHESMEDCTIDGFYIPKGSRVLVNVWAIGRDPDAWPNPEKFYPERFIGSTVNAGGRNFQLIPFGTGRRSCPGMQLGLTVTRLALAQLIHCFDWELPNGLPPTELDMTEKTSLVLPRANHLCAIPKYRLNGDDLS